MASLKREGTAAVGMARARPRTASSRSRPHAKKILDESTPSTIVASIDDSGGYPDNGAGALVIESTISADGRYVAFSTDATNMVDGEPTSEIGNVYVRDTRANTTLAVSDVTSS